MNMFIGNIDLFVTTFLVVMLFLLSGFISFLIGSFVYSLIKGEKLFTVIKQIYEER